MKFILTLFMFLSVAMMTVASTPSFAESKLFVSPTRVELDHKKKVELMNVSNVTNKTQTFEISVVDLVMKEDGTTVQSNQSPYSAKKMVRFYPRKFTVEPGARQTIRIMAKYPPDTADGEYHSHIRIFEAVNLEGVEKTKAVRLDVAKATSLPIILTKGKIDTVVGWTNPTIKKSTAAGQYSLTGTLTRSGNGQGNAFIDIFHVSSTGEKVQIGQRRNIYIYRELDKRNLKNDFKPPEGARSGDKIIAVLYSGNRTEPTFVEQVTLSIP